MLFFLMILRPPRATLFPYTTLIRSDHAARPPARRRPGDVAGRPRRAPRPRERPHSRGRRHRRRPAPVADGGARRVGRGRSEEHTSELQSRQYLVCPLLLDKNTLILD